MVAMEGTSSCPEVAPLIAQLLCQPLSATTPKSGLASDPIHGAQHEREDKRKREEPGWAPEQLVYRYFPRGISSSLKRTKPEGFYREILVGALEV